MKITLISHCCSLIEMGGKRVLTDPWMTEPLYWGRLFHRYGVGLPIAELGPLDLILASHGHDDHLDPATLRQLDPSTPVAVWKKAARKVRKVGYTDVYPMVDGEQYRQDGLTVHAFAGKHPGGLVTYVLEADGETCFFAGDTAYTDRLLQVRERFECLDVSLLPISGGRAFFGAYPYHMGPGESLQLAGALSTRVAIPTHYHFKPVRVPGFIARSMRVEGRLTEFVERAPDLCPQVKVVTLGVGQTWDSRADPG